MRSQAKRLFRSSFRLIFFHYGRFIFSIHHHFIHTFVWGLTNQCATSRYLKCLLSEFMRCSWIHNKQTHTHTLIQTNPSSEACSVRHTHLLHQINSFSQSVVQSFTLQFMDSTFDETILWTKNLLIKNFLCVSSCRCRWVDLLSFYFPLPFRQVLFCPCNYYLCMYYIFFLWFFVLMLVYFFVVYSHQGISIFCIAKESDWSHQHVTI